MKQRMSSERWAEVDRLLDQILTLPSAERAGFVESATRNDLELQSEVMALLRQLDTRDDVLDRSALAVFARGDDESTSIVGQRVGAFRIVSLLGRGGMGEVYRAERADGQFEQTVALKLLRPDAIEHIDRFLAERQILARLDHPGIARVFDAGLTNENRPYMVMELVDGEPLTTWLTQTQPTLRARLQLFLQICEAVAYAHRNLIVHRDLKPGNVLVTADHRAKLLDFGIAKLLSTAAGEETRSTPLTLAYAAPEQLMHGAVTTATDIYSLGVLLFELLAGARPWEIERLPMAVAINKVLDEAPPRASELAEPRLRPQISGDLDAVIAKALRKTPSERYQTVSELQADIIRHLRGEAILARSGVRSYVLGRFLRRHRWEVAGVVSLIAALSAGLAGVAWQAREAERERDIARTEAARSDAVRDYVMLMFREAGENQGEGDLTAKQVLERSAESLLAQSRDANERAEVFQVLGELFAAIDDYEGAAPIFRAYLQNPPSSDPALLAEVRHDFATAEFRLGHFDEARSQLAQAQAFWNRDPQRYRESLASSRVIESQLQRQAGEIDGAIATLRTGLSDRIAISGRNHRETAYIMNALALALMDANQLQEADRTLDESLQIMAALGRQDSANALTMVSNQAVIAARLGDNIRAEPLFRRAVELRRKLYGRSAALAALQQNLGRVMVRTGRAKDAQPMIEDALSMAQEFGGTRSPLTLTIMLAVAEVRMANGELSSAETMLQSASQALGEQFGTGHALYARGEQLLARLRLAQHRPAEARRALDSAERKLKALGPGGAPYLPEIEALRKQLTS